MRGRDRRGSREPRGKSALATAEAAMKGFLFSWLRPDSLSGTSLVDKVHPTNTMTLAAGSSSISNSASFGGKPVLALNGTQRYESSLAASSWKFLLNSFEVFVVARRTNNTDGYLFRVGGSAAPAMGIYTLSTDVGGSLTYNDTTPIINVSQAGFWVSPTYMNLSYQEGITSPEYVFRQKSTVFSSGDSSAAPTSADPSGTLTIGGVLGGTLFLVGEIADVLIANVQLTASQRSTVQTYINLRYGIAP